MTPRGRWRSSVERERALAELEAARRRARARLAAVMAKQHPVRDRTGWDRWWR